MYTERNKTMRRFAQLAVVLLALNVFVPAAFAKKHERPPFPTKILEASSVFVDCDCRKEMAASVPNAMPELLDWGRFQIARDRKHADLILLFSMNEYLGDYLTRDGPDKRPADVDFTILTVIDAHTGEELWSDSRRWGYMLVARASRDLIRDFRLEVAQQIKQLTLDDILSCSNSPSYAVFSHLTPEEALAKSDSDVTRIANAPNRLAVDPPGAPDFCKQAQLVLGPDNKIFAFEVFPPRSETLELPDLIRDADQFDFASGKDVTGKVYFNAESKDKKLTIHFDMEGRRSILASVEYLY